MEARRYCDAPKRHTKEPCHKPAGWGTDHPGKGPCKLHGGCALFPTGPANPNYRHGRYSKHHPPERVAEFEQWRVNSGSHVDQLSAEDEWGLFCLEDYIAQYGHTLLPAKLAELLDTVSNIRLKAQKLRGGEKASEVNVNINARDELLSRIAGLAARRSAPGDTAGTD